MSFRYSGTLLAVAALACGMRMSAVPVTTALAPLSTPPSPPPHQHRIRSVVVVTTTEQPVSSSRRDFWTSSCSSSAAAAAAAVVAMGVSSFPVPAVAAATTATTTTPSSSTYEPPVTGAKAPAFELPNSRGKGVTSLAQLTASNKWTVLYFYPGAFTQGCTMEARAFQRDLEEYRRLNAQIVGVSVDPPEKNAQFCTSEGLDFYMLSDTGGRVSKSYGSALSIPGFGTFSNRQTYLIDPKGNLRWVFTDVESRIARHSGEVLEKLTELEA